VPDLTWNTYISPVVAIATNDFPPGFSERTWSPISSVLISGERDAVLVDPPLTVDQADAVAEWVARSGKNLTIVYATHGHGDHFFGAGALLRRFPQARFYATPGVVALMRAQASPESLEGFWEPRFPGQIPAGPVVADELAGGEFELEGHTLVAVELGHTDTDATTCLYVPSIGLVVAGDAAYNDVHQYLAESAGDGLQRWIDALDVIEALHPRAVVAGHKRAGRADDPGIVAETRQYLRDVQRILPTARTARDLYDRMLELYPDRVNPGALWGGAWALRPRPLASAEKERL
jgi:glyoxylase-like metal-dependent hydrolase (beta-lactamase superfamily II)